MSKNKEEKSVLLEDKEQVTMPTYSDEEAKYLGGIFSRMLESKIERDQKHPEFNNMTYLEWFAENERIANTYVIRNKGTKNAEFVVQSGTVEQKLLTVLSEINRLNLTGEVRVFDTQDNELYELGTALSDIVDKTKEMEGDNEKKLIRQMELLKQGTVFVQDNWVKKWKVNKEITKNFDGKFNSVEWTRKMENIFDGPESSILYAPGVYLGNIREFDMQKQPYIFTMKVSSYEECKSRYGNKDADGKFIWERWKYVPKDRVTMLATENFPSFNFAQGFSLTGVDANIIEEIHYQDQINDEYQVFLNGVPMLPVGFPLSAISPGGMFNVEKQVLQVINPFFGYGRSFVAKTKELSDLLDEMIRLLVLKTRKSIHPPYANISGRVISEKSLMPGAISMNIDPNALVPIGAEGQGATASEYQMLKELRENLDRVTVSPQIQGQAGKSGTTAYEVNLLQQQAQKMIGLIVFAASQLEKKMTWLRLNYVKMNYFEPIGTKVDDVRNKIKNIYRETSRQTSLEGKGKGIRKIIPIENNENNLTSKDVYYENEYEGTPLPEIGRRRTRTELNMMPLQKIYLDLSVMKACKYIFFIEVSAKPKDTSNNAKLMFREELRDLQALREMGSSVNIQEMEDRYAVVWNKRKEKLFGKPMQEQALQANAGGGSKVLNENIPSNMPMQEEIG